MSGLIVAAVLILFRMPRFGRLVGVLAIAQLIAFSLYPVAAALMQPLEDEARAEAAKAPACCYDAIVVLGGSIGPAVPPLRPDPELYDSSDRVWHAARLFHRGVASRIIVSGGSYAVAMGDAPAEQTEAMAMRQFLIALGVPEDRIVNEATLVEHHRKHARDARPGRCGPRRAGDLRLSHAAGDPPGACGRPRRRSLSDGLADHADGLAVLGTAVAVARRPRSYPAWRSRNAWRWRWIIVAQR